MIHSLLSVIVPLIAFCLAHMTICYESLISLVLYVDKLYASVFYYFTGLRISLCDSDSSRVLSFPWAVPFSWARYSPPALTWPRSDPLFQASAAAGLLSRPSLFLLEPGRRWAFFPRFLFFTKALWTILEYFEIWPYLVQLSIFKFI